MAPYLTPPPISGFKVRPARRGDAGSVVTLLAETGVTADPNLVPWIISHPEMELLVAADGQDKVIGFITLSHRPMLKSGGRAGTIDELNVAKAWQRKGVGRELLRRVVERAKVLSVKRLAAETYGPVTAELRAFFSACNFELVDAALFRLK